MAKRRTTLEGYIRFLLRHRVAVALLVTLITGVFFYGVVNRLRIYTDFIALMPPNHPYIKLYQEFRHMFGTANVLVCAVEVKEGDIYNLETIAKIDRITDALLATPGCNPAQVISLTHPKLKNIEVTSLSIEMRPVIWP
jgi:predicted RND superfamily exporter protein